MNLTKTKPILTVHYAPGLLVVLQRKPCPSRDVPGARYDRRTPYYEIASGLYLLQAGEQSWCLERCWIPRKVIA